MARMQTDWHSPCERRVDGDRITEMIPAREWLSGRPSGQRGPDVNPLVPDPFGLYPPGLPRHLQRDHLHDRNREHGLFDPANPGLATYVRVTRRRHNDPVAEAEVSRRRAEMRNFEVEREQMEAKLANELLETRSKGLRKAMADRSRLNMQILAARGEKPPEVFIPPADTSKIPSHEVLSKRAAELQRRMQVLQSTPFKTSQQIAQMQATPSHMRTAPATAPAQAPSAASRVPYAGPYGPTRKTAGTGVPLRGGSWPVEMYFKL